MKKTKSRVKPKEKPIQNTESYTAEAIDRSEPVYNNCIFNQIDTAFIGDPKMMMAAGAQKGMPEGVSKQEVEEVRKQMVDYIAGITNFNPEMIERILQQAEEFMRNRFNG